MVHSKETKIAILLSWGSGGFGVNLCPMLTYCSDLYVGDKLPRGCYKKLPMLRKELNRAWANAGGGRK